MIELDVSEPWEPPEPPARRLVRGRRWPAVMLVGVVALGLLVAGGPAPGDGPAYRIEHQVRNVNAAGDRLFVGRYATAGSTLRLEAYGLRDGTPLWSVPIAPNQQFALATDRVLVLTTEYGDHSAASSSVAVLDAATGARLWHRDGARVTGQAHDRIVLEDVSGVPERGPADAPPTDDDPVVNRASEQRDSRYIALDDRTGAAAWQVDVPKGSVADFAWNIADHYRLIAFTELGPTGLLQTRDLRTGAVTGRRRLDWSGTISMFTVGDSFLTHPGGPDQVMVYKAGERGADIFDRATGARLWHWAGQRYSGLFICAPDRYCTAGEDGVGNLDARTGRLVWQIGHYDSILHLDERIVVLGSYADAEAGGGDVVVVDARTGAVLQRLDGWHVIFNVKNTGIVVWRQLDDRHALLGRLDPRTGHVTVFGRTGPWFGQPECDIQDGLVACVVVGAMSVWRLPPAPSA